MAPDSPAIRLDRAVAYYLRAARKVARGGGGGRAAADLKVALAAADELDPDTAARAWYAAAVVALRRGDGGEARGYLASLRKQKARGDYLSPRSPSQHLELLVAYANALLKNHERALEIARGLRASKRKGSPEQALLRWALERVGVAALKAGRKKEALEHLNEAWSIGRDPALESNLLAARWPKKGPKYEKRWAALAREVPEALFNYAVSLDRAGRTRQAWSAYQRYAGSGGANADKAREEADAKARIFGFGEE